MENDNSILFEKYVTRKLPESEIIAFKNRLREDAAFNEEFKLYKSIHIFLEKDRNQPALETKLETIGTQYFQEEKKEKIIPIRNSKKRWLTVMTTAAAAILIFLWFNPFQEDDLFRKYSQYNDLHLVEQSDGNRAAAEADLAFNQKDYRLAYEKIKVYLEGHKENTKAYLHLGICALETGRLEEAQAIFENIANGNTLFKNHGIWYLALYHLKLENTEQTKSYLSQIPESEDRLYRKAQALLKDLE